ncbi:MAG: hypothetical protein WDM90_15765 [Ferruginibacter sp.]
MGAYAPGDFKFKDVNGDGKITADDRTYIGNPTPKFTYGTSINITYKNFNLVLIWVVYTVIKFLEHGFFRITIPTGKLLG